MLQPKDIDWLNGSENTTGIYVVYKRPTSALRTHTDWQKGQKKIFHANGNQKKARVAILISDKKDFKIKTITGDKEGHTHTKQRDRKKRKPKETRGSYTYIRLKSFSQNL